MRTREELKKLANDAIENRRQDIYKIGDSIYSEPELGYKEFKTAEKVKDVLKDLDLDYEDGIAITGIKSKIKGRESKYNIGLMGELDSVISPLHPDADKETGAVHACGHNAMIATIIGVLYALKDTDIMEDLAGDVSIMAIPAEEYIELGYRNQLIEEGKIKFIGGKPEFIRLGAFDDVDIAIIQHLFSETDAMDTGLQAAATQSFNGFIGQEIKFIGKEAHAGAAPFAGVNALQAANVALAAINAQRETFKEEDVIRIHPIITKGGDLVNTVPADVRLETYIRGANVKGILDATEKVTRSWKAGALALGAEVEINTMPGYLPSTIQEDLVDVVYENLKIVYNKDKVVRQLPHLAGSSDVGDVSSIMPTIQPLIGGASGNFHGDTYRLVDRELAYIKAAKTLALVIIDLLYDGTKIAEKIVNNYKPIYTKETYLEEWGNIGKRFK